MQYQDLELLGLTAVALRRRNNPSCQSLETKKHRDLALYASQDWHAQSIGGPVHVMAKAMASVPKESRHWALATQSPLPRAWRSAPIARRSIPQAASFGSARRAVRLATTRCRTRSPVTLRRTGAPSRRCPVERRLDGRHPTSWRTDPC